MNFLFSNNVTGITATRYHVPDCESPNDFDFGRVKAIEQPIGKMPEASPANGIVNRLKLSGIVAHLLNQGLVLVKEPDGQAELNIRILFQRSGKFGMRWRR